MDKDNFKNKENIICIMLLDGRTVSFDQPTTFFKCINHIPTKEDKISFLKEVKKQSDNNLFVEIEEEYLTLDNVKYVEAQNKISTLYALSSSYMNAISKKK